MKKYAFSHGAAVFVCSFASFFILDAINQYIPRFSKFLNEGSSGLNHWLTHSFGRSPSAENVATVTIATLLAVFWGMVFSWFAKR